MNRITSKRAGNALLCLTVTSLILSFTLYYSGRQRKQRAQEQSDQILELNKEIGILKSELHRLEKEAQELKFEKDKKVKQGPNEEGMEGRHTPPSQP